MNNTYNNFNNITSDIKEGYESIRSPGLLSFDTAGIILTAAWNVLELVFEMPVLMHNMLLASITDFGIPSGVGNLILTFLYSFILVSIVFTIINYLSRGGSKI